MSYIKDNHHYITRLYLDQFGAAFMGLVLSLSTSMSKNNTLILLSSVFAILFYMYLQYSVMWDLGARDIIRVEGGRMEYQPLIGLKMTARQNIPNAIIAVGVVIGSIFGSADGAFRYEWAGSLYVIAKGIGVVWEGMFNGLVELYSPHNPIIYVLMLIPPIFAGTVGYFAGTKNFTFLGLFGIYPKHKN